ncbi:flagellar biosynthetic protein FliQ [Sansalvadorimonas sp. 2012CJ34-2]|uniref:Flagellar biosynthetic protein FliQ n=1 Tax=Parendozoicomonas callyspongiae TaxID=2942213 RepID=A0ABT0PDV7_9GAMM|nr:flagellar biosynthetic protein FliQ [Sansalvadorimonas sp. 2012CJ34-2]MCL6269535.1 flagellar biosynthetic protein FliQ [Sansalvadorimonas sp. 2012CJ34-2]
MNPDLAADILRDALFLATKIVALLLLPGLITGLIISIFQAATQITEQTLSFLPRLLVTLVTIALASHWLIQELSDLFVRLYQAVPDIV